MLILTRKCNESLIIGEGDDQVVITVIAVQGQQVRLGTKAPRHVPVHREEIYERILAERILNGEC